MRPDTCTFGPAATTATLQVGPMRCCLVPSVERMVGPILVA